MKSKQSVKSYLMPLFFSLAILFGIFIGRFLYLIGGNEKTDLLQDIKGMFHIYPRSDKLTKVIKYVSMEYVDPIDEEDLIEKTIPKLIGELDPHSQYISAKDLQSVREPLEGNFSGIGVQFNMLNDTLIILKTIPNGPSEKVGLLAGDRILVVNGDTVAGKNVPSDSIVRRLKGPKGTSVNVGIQRHAVSELIYFDIIRDKIPLYSMDIAYMIRPGIGYIKLNTFSATTSREFFQGTNDLLSQGMTKLILDLRNNGGGYMEPAIRIADQFLDEGQLIVYTEGNARPRHDYPATKGGLCSDLELVILIDEGTASASEILAGALQDNDKGTIIGRRSFGKGLVQDQRPFPDGSAIRLTIARYYTPTGRSIQKPYENGENEEYFLELSTRYMNGEFSKIDSTKFDESLKFTTPKGKIVYGGGGIMPDIFVPVDTTGVTDYLIKVRNRGLIYRFALEYTDKHRDELESMDELNAVLSYLKKQNAFEDFIRFAAKNDVPRNTQDIRISGDILKTQLYAYIVRNILDDEGFYPVIETVDNTLQEAIQILSSE